MSNLAKYLLFFFASSVLVLLYIGVVFYVESTFGQNSPYFIISIIGFVVLMLLLIFVGGNRLAKSFAPNDIPNGLPATATIQSVKQGNLKVTSGVQEIYQLAIEVVVSAQNGETWPAQLKLMVPIVQIAQFQPGVSLAVKYDPNNRSKVVIDQSAQTQQQQQPPVNNSYNIPGFGTVNSQMAQQALQNQPQEIVLAVQANKVLLESLRNSGVSATATVLSRETVQENFMPGVDVIKVRFRVERINYETEQLIITPKSSLFKSEPGKPIYVLYDPNNPKRVGISGLDKPDGIVAL